MCPNTCSGTLEVDQTLLERAPFPGHPFRRRVLDLARVEMFVPMTTFGIRAWAIVWKMAQSRVATPIIEWIAADRGHDQS
jgi:hypothetical protein